MKIKRLCFYFLVAFSVMNIILPVELVIGGKAVSPDYIVALFLVVYLFMVAFNEDKGREFIVYFKDFSKSLLGILMLLTAVVMVISVVYSRERALALKETFRFFINIFLLFTVRYYITDNKDLKTIIKTIFFATIIVCVYGVLQNFTNIGLKPQYINVHSVGANRITATFHHPNAYGAFLVLFLFPLLMLILSCKSMRAKLLYSLISVLVVVNIIFTLSRNSWLAVAIGFFILALCYSKRLLIPFILVLLIAAQIPMINDRLKDFADNDQNSSRIKHWKTAALMIKDHPYIGVGNGNYISYYDDYIKANPHLDFNNESRFPTHNSYLKVISELGIIGSLPFIALLFVSIYNIRKYAASVNDVFLKAFFTGFFASGVAFLFMNFIDNILFVPKIAVFFWIFVGIGRGDNYKLKSGRKN